MSEGPPRLCAYRRTRIPRSRGFEGLLLGALGGVALAWHPALAQPNAASALLLGLLLPPRVGAVAARRAARETPWQALSSGIATALRGLGAAWCLLALLAAVRGSPFCAPWRGASLWALGPLTGCLLAAALGTLCGIAAGTRGAVLAAAIPWLGLLLGIWRFHHTPSVALFGHFAGWFPGTPYDERLPIPSSYFVFRLLTLLWTLGVSLLAVAWSRRRAGWWPWREVALALVCLLGASWAEGTNGTWGYARSRRELDEALGQRLWGRRCVLHAPRQMPRGRLLRHLKDCDVRIAQMAARLGVSPPERIHVFWFASAEQKRRLVGAGRTHVAKPWRMETYVQDAPWPHPTLAHEVAHLVAAQAARGPWRVAGRWSGWWPEPVWIEGLAVALAWSPREGASPHQWARALLERGELPPLRSLQGLGFLLHSPPHAYTAAGSFLRFLWEQQGAAPLRRLYRDGGLDAIGDRAVLETRWHAFLRSVPMDEALRERVADRFAPRGMLAVRCAAPLAEARSQAFAALAAGAFRACDRALSRWERLAPSDASLQVARIERLAAAGRIAEGRRELASLRRRGLARAFVARAQWAIARALWRLGHRVEARRIFARLTREPLPPDALRVVEVSLIGLEAGGAQERLLRAWFAPMPGSPLGAAEAMMRAVRLERLRTDGLGAYLQAGLLLREERFAEAADRLTSALRRGLPTDRLRREAARRLALAWSAMGAKQKAEAAWRQIAERGGEGAIEARDFLDRLRLEAAPRP